jgi:hypothetical protein
MKITRAILHTFILLVAGSNSLAQNASASAFFANTPLQKCQIQGFQTLDQKSYSFSNPINPSQIYSHLQLCPEQQIVLVSDQYASSFMCEHFNYMPPFDRSFLVYSTYGITQNDSSETVLDLVNYNQTGEPVMMVESRLQLRIQDSHLWIQIIKSDDDKTEISSLCSP